MNPTSPPFGGEALSPGLFLTRAAAVYGDRTAVVDGDQLTTYGQMADRCSRLAGLLAGELGVAPGDRVSVQSPNSALALEAHFGVPWSGGVLNMLNTRLNPGECSYIVGHCHSKVLLVDGELADAGHEIAARVDHRVRLIVAGPSGGYDEAVLGAPPIKPHPAQDWDLLSINYTSGTTGRPKGVMYSHRGAYLQALAMVAQARIDPDSAYLWSLPMFHCNGWCFPWSVTAAGARHVLLRRVEPAAIWRALREQGITNFSAAPTVLSDLAYAPQAGAGPLTARIRVTTGGAPPSPALLDRLDDLHLDVTHLYGLTETYGPAAVSEWSTEWDHLPKAERARRRARQGIPNLVGNPIRVVNESGDVPWDATTPGEILFRGPNVMLGYYLDPEATADADAGGWFRSGDVGVIHPDGYLEIRDRAKDVIVSGGENIASIEIEQVLSAHPSVRECAVVAAPDPRWGEVPVAYVVPAGETVDGNELIRHCKDRIARFKAPKRVLVVAELPRTSTGKVQKFALRQPLWAEHEAGVN